MKQRARGRLADALVQPDAPPPHSPVLANYLAIKPYLKQYLMRFFVRHQDVEDVLQETFLRAFQSEQQQHIRSPKSFLYKIGKHLALSEKAGKAAQLMSYVGDFDELAVIDTKPSMEDALEVQERLAHLNRLIQELPPQCRRVLIMRKVFGLSHKEVARRLNITVKTVEQHLTKGLQHCHQEAAASGQADAAGLVVPARSADASPGGSG